MHMKDITNKWEERFGWLWYGSEAVYRWDDARFESEAARYQDNGITAVILFGAHFRFSFYAYWDDIVRTIGRFVTAFHARGIKVIEHHSSHLTYAPLSESVWDTLLASDGKWGLGGFPGFRATSQSNPPFGGVRLDDFAQIDGSTGEKALSSYIHTEGRNMDWIFKHYNGNAHCFNNPAYESAYKEHLRNIIAVGVDGIMNDDVQWFGGGNACTCRYCRDKFRSLTGYELPSPDEWDGFYENYSDPKYIAWKKFKKNSSAEFHYRLDEFYTSLGFQPLRPAYCAEVLPFDSTCYGFEGGAGLWDYIFQECCGIIRESYVCFAGEAVHRYALARRHGVPSMALMYPASRDATYAAWALCRSWGQLYTGGDSSNPVLYEGKCRAFEKKYAEYYRAPDKVSDISFWFSKKTRDYCDHDAPRKYMKPLMSCIESAYLSGIGCDMVFEDDTADTLSRSRLIAAVSVEQADDAELARLREYAESGGHLFISGVFAEKDDSYNPRTLNCALGSLGMTSRVAPRMAVSPVTVSFGGNTAVFPKADVHHVFTRVRGEVFAVTPDGACCGVTERVGKGMITVFPCETGENPIQPAIWQTGEKTFVQASQTEEMKSGNGALLSLLAGRRVAVSGAEDVIPTVFVTAAGTVIHLVNTHGMLSDHDTFVGRSDLIPQFDDTDPGREMLPALTLSLNGVDIGGCTVCRIATPERDDEAVADIIHDATGGYSVTIPAGVFSGYAMLIFG